MLIHSFAGSNIIGEIFDRVLAMSDDVVWIVTDEVVEAEVGGRDAKSKGNPYDYVDSQPVKALRRGVAVSAEKLEQGMVDFVEIGRAHV